MAGKTDYLKLSKPLLSEAADIAVLNGNFDMIDGEFIAVNGRLKKNTLYINESRNWTVPDNVTQIDIFIVDGGYDGEAGEKASSSSVTSAGSGNGGYGGDGGACAYYPNLSVVPNTAIPVVVGAANGGKSSFDGMETINITGAEGGNPVSSQKPRGGSYPVINNIYTGIGSYCPIDRKHYGISGACGQDCERSSVNISVAGGTAGKKRADLLPTQGESKYNSSGSVQRSSGGGGSYDNDGAGNDGDKIAGKGGDAVTPGCGGGGGGGTVYSGGTIGLGGAGAPGVVIIAY
ncbi:MAG: hypothetical protein ACOX7J_02735 [Bacillota bacterium]|jgi:hypothetical protein